MEHLSNDHEYHPNQHKNSHKLCNEMDNMTTTWSEFPNGGKTIVNETLASKKINKSRRAGL